MYVTGLQNSFVTKAGRDVFCVRVPKGIIQRILYMAKYIHGPARAALFLVLLVAGGFFAGCSGPQEPPPGDRLFTLLPSSWTGVRFENRLRPTESFNVFTYRNYFNGGGVGIADLNGDGLRDLVLTANQAPDRLYLNQGAFRFEDATSRAGLESGRGWSTGVSIADVNGDGLPDIYICRSGSAAGSDRANLLFVHTGLDDEGVPRFEERAADYGLDDTGFSVHAAFLDYDRDGDLDMYLVNNSPREVSSFGLQNIRDSRHEGGGDKLYRNEGDVFVDASAEAGVYGSEIAFGLDVVASDFDADGWLDLYVSNDFFERDYFYRNNGDGTFAEALETHFPHVSLSSMGNDAADMDNDGRTDLYVTDMLPQDEYRLKTTGSHESWDIYQDKVARGFYHQFTRNTLQHNLGGGAFSDIAPMAGVEATDWSWSALLVDLDMDGHKDILVTNGVYRDVIDQDFMAFFAGEIQRMARERADKLDYLELLERMPSEPIPNVAFRGNGDRTFADKTAEWGLDAPAFSNGAAYGDLDNDGDPDLVINNIDEEIFIYRNEADTLHAHRFLQVALAGEGGNRFGVGARVTVWQGAVPLVQEQMPSRGFQSTVDHVLTFGLGTGAADSVEARWPDGRRQVLKRPAINSVLTLRQAEAGAAPSDAFLDAPMELSPRFADVTQASGLAFAHAENEFVDFEREPLPLRMLSTEGPRLAVGDVDGDGLDDVYVGGAKGSPGGLFRQRPGGRFEALDAAPFVADALSEDVDAAFFDADGDGDRDLYVASGGSEYSELAPALRDRLYLNDGAGRFAKAPAALPSLYASSACVVPADYDGDGDLDLFVGARSIPWQYGLAPASALLRNDGRGRFTDVTEEAAPALRRIGMVTDAAWFDANADARPDLVVVGEWMPVTLFLNEGTLVPQSGNGLDSSHGWWNRLLVEDMDGDGDMDFVVGNLGLNTPLHASETAPLTMHVNDFDRNGRIDQVISLYRNGTRYPMALRQDLFRQLPMLAQRFPRFADYAGTPLEDVFTPEELASSVARHAYTLATSYVENLGDGGFALRPLPFEAQRTPIYALVAGDFDEDGARDLLLAGNFHAAKPELGRMDAGYGLFLRGDGAGAFSPVPMAVSGFRAPGQARDMALAGEGLVAITFNDGPVQLISIR